MKYEEAFTAFLDFLGFSEASRDLDKAARLKLLNLLLTLVHRATRSLPEGKA